VPHCRSGRGVENMAFYRPLDRRSAPDCRFFLSGLCIKGAECPFVHNEAAAAAAAAPGGAGVACLFFQQGRCNRGASCRFLHANLPVSSRRERTSSLSLSGERGRGALRCPSRLAPPLPCQWHLGRPCPTPRRPGCHWQGGGLGWGGRRPLPDDPTAPPFPATPKASPQF